MTTEAPALLVGREHDLAAVRAVMKAVPDGARGLVAVTGTPGVGRSAFLDATARLAADEGFAVLRADGSRLEQGLASGLAGQLLDGLSGAEGPAAVLVDDLQWADEESLTWLAGLLTGATPLPGAGHPLFLAVAVCEGEPAAELPGVQDMLRTAEQIVRLGPLGSEGVRAVLARNAAVLHPAGGSVSDDEIRGWERATGGNPALIASLLDRLAGPDGSDASNGPDLPDPSDRTDPSGRSGPSEEPPPADDDPAPPRPSPLTEARARPAPWRLRGRVAAALSGHPRPVRQFAYCAAVLGGEAEESTIARLAGLDPAEEAAAARALRLLGWVPARCEPPVLWDCVREIAEDAYGLAGCEDLHRRAAVLCFASGAPVEQVATHLLETGPRRHAQTAEVLREAAVDARRRGESERAIRYLRRALREFPPDSPQRGTFLAALADAEQDVDTAAMLRHVAQAAPLLESARERAAVVAGVPLTLSLSASPAAYEVIEAARATLGTVEAPGAEGAELAARLEARARLSRLGDPTAPADAGARLRELGPDAGRGSAARRELVAVLTFAGTASGQLPAGEAATHVRHLLEREPASSSSWYATASLVIASGTAAEAAEPVRSWLDMALEAAARRGDDRQRIRMLCWRAMAAQHSGSLADAWSDARDACEWAPESAADALREPARSTSPPVLGENDWLSALGLLSVAIEMRDPWLASRAQALCANESRSVKTVLRAGRLALRAQSTPTSELPALVTDLLDCVDRAETAGWHNPALFPLAYWATPLLLRLGDKETALELVARECDRARAWGRPTTLGRTLRMWGTLVPGRYALSLLAESVAVLRGGSNTLELARALTAYGTRLRAAGRPGAAELLDEADGIADTMGTSLLRCWAEPGRGESHGLGLLDAEHLSVTERRVAGLVALGHTNQDVAEELDVTRRAVEKCLTRLYRRLGVSSRAELIPVVRRTAGTTAFRWGLFSGNP